MVKTLRLFMLLALAALVVPLLAGGEGRPPALAANPTITEYPVPTADSYPWQIASGPDGALWFTEYSRGKIGRITTGGAITEYALPNTGCNPWGIAAGPDGAVWFTEFSCSTIGRITSAGAITEYPLPATNSDPAGIAAGPDGALWFAEYATYSSTKIGRITTGGAITEYPLSTGGPVYIAAGPDGALWFTQNVGAGFRDSGKIGRITTDGAVTQYTPPKGGQYLILGITAGPDGALWFTEGYPGLSAGGNVGRITTSGAITEYTLPTTNSIPAGIAAGPDGALWFTEYGGNIGRITTDGAITEYPLPTNSSPGGIAAGADGALWFTEGTNGNKIGRVSVPVPVSQADQLSIAQKFSSMLMESGDDFRPKDIRIMTADQSGTSAARIRSLTGSVLNENPFVSDVCGALQTATLDIKGPSPLIGNSRDYRSAYQSLEGSYADTTYARVVSDPEDPSKVAAVQYWFFYFYNNWGVDQHEGDWEQITLTFQPSATAAQILADQELPSQLGYSEHWGGTRKFWQPGATHPTVYVGYGSHANYFAAGSYVQSAHIGVDHAVGNIAVSPSVTLLPQTEPSACGQTSDWLKFRGLWGEGLFAFARGPVTQPAWQDPVDWVESLSTDGSWSECASALSDHCIQPPAATPHVNPAENVQHLATLDDNNSVARFAVQWLGSTVDASLISPSGRVIDADTAASDVDHVKGGTFEVYYIQNPEPGQWTVNLFGADLPAGGEDVSVSVSTDPATTPLDIDSDGCNNDQELGSNAMLGGQRDPFNPWDYFNPTHDGVNRADDILKVVQHYHKDDTDGNPGLPPYTAGYDPDTDRTSIGPNPWNLGPPDGLVRSADILAAVKQYHHDCV